MKIVAQSTDMGSRLRPDPAMIYSLIPYQLAVLAAGWATSSLVLRASEDPRRRRPATPEPLRLFLRSLLWQPLVYGAIACACVLVYMTLLSRLQVIFFGIGTIFWAGVLWVPARLAERTWHHRRAMLLYPAVTISIGVWALCVEPYRIEATKTELAFERVLPAAAPIKVAQVSDIQTSFFGPRERAVPAIVNGFEPDIVVCTGDYLVPGLKDDDQIASAQRVLREIKAPIFAVDGDSEEESHRRELFAGLPGVRYLQNEAAKTTIRGSDVWVVGVNRHGPDVAKAFSGVPPGAFTILLQHSPDVVLLLEDRKPDLVLAGHTHGGQVCLPGIGALLTLTKLPRRFASGLFREFGTTLYVCRGIGLEGRFAPQVRLFCRPEVALFELRSSRTE